MEKKNNDNKEYGRSVERVHSKDYMNMSSYPLTRTTSKTNIVKTDKRNSSFVRWIHKYLPFDSEELLQQIMNTEKKVIILK